MSTERETVAAGERVMSETLKLGILALLHKGIRKLRADPPRPLDEDGDPISIFHLEQAG